MDIFIILLSVFLVTLCAILRHRFKYWEKLGVPQLETSTIYGTLPLIKSLHLHEFFKHFYEKSKGKYKCVGTYLFFKPIVVFMDLDVIKHVLIKDFNNFMNRTHDYHNEEQDPLAQNIARLNGDKWRSLRNKMTPTFTSGKIRNMLPIILDVAENFRIMCEKELKATSDNTLEIKDLLSRFTTDVIGNVIFGIECNSFKDPNNMFRKFARNINKPQIFNVQWRLFTLTYMDFMKFFGVQQFSPVVSNFIMKMVGDTIDMREKNNIKRNDFLEILMELKNKKDENGEPILTFTEVAAQAFIFFAAGFETSAGNVTSTLFELANNPDIQEKLRYEIFETLEKHNNIITYEALNEMPYLDQVINESMRKYPALTNVSRVAKNDFAVPGTNIVIPGGTKCFIPIKQIHYDPEIWENPEEYRPERFDPAEVAKRHPQAFLGFGDGPRNCIGMRFGRLQSRIGLVTLLKTFKFSVSEKTPKEIEFNKYNNGQVFINDIHLRMDKLDN